MTGLADRSPAKTAKPEKNVETFSPAFPVMLQENPFSRPQGAPTADLSRNARIPSCYSQACHCHPPTGYPRS